MTRTIVSFEPLGDTTVVKLEDAPTDIPGLGENAVADLSALTGTIIERGQALKERLAAHPPVRAGLEAVLSLPPAADPSPLYFHMLAACADQLPWEQLYDARHGFCALDRRWPIGRIARRRREFKDRVFVPPLHIVAVLSAAKRTGLPQLKALLRAVSTSDADAIGVELHVISAEQDVLDAVAAAGRPDVTCETLAATAPNLAESIAVAEPDILHLLCHGGAVAGVRTLEFASVPDFDAEEDTGSVRLTMADLVGALEYCDPWLVILSACETAEATDAPALAHDMVSNGIPAVAGMRRLVDLSDTNRFCEALYPEVLAAVRKAVDPALPEGVRVIDWAETFTKPRVTIGGSDPCTADAWSDPVLYVQDDPLRVYRGSPALSTSGYSHLRAQLVVWEGYRASLDPATVEPAVLSYVESRIADLRDQLAAGDAT